MKNDLEMTPLHHGGNTAPLYVLKQTSAEMLQYRPTLSALLLPIMLLFIGLLLSYSSVHTALETAGDAADPSSTYLAGFAFGLVILSAGGFLLFRHLKPRVFDSSRGYFWIGWQKPRPDMPTDPKAAHVRLADIENLQILSKEIIGRSPYICFELNLVLHTGERLNLTSHTDQEQIEGEAAALAAFLEVRVKEAQRSSPKAD